MNKFFSSLYLWIDSQNHNKQSVDWLRCLPFVLTHLACIGVFWVGYSWQAILLCLASYLFRMFGITAFYHRFFSHRSYKTSRVAQFIFALIGASAAQRGALWWSAHHRYHHKYSDQKEDMHSPHQHSFFHSHIGWFISQENFATDNSYIKDLQKYPELVFLNRYDVLVPLAYAACLYALGGWLFVIWGYFISTVILYHATFCINSLAHTYGVRKYPTKDHSKNNWWLAIITLGEGWHNNHHYWPSSARQGFTFKEIDITYMLLKLMEFFGLIWDLRVPPRDIIYAK